jgi:hypothetical protein
LIQAVIKILAKLCLPKKAMIDALRKEDELTEEVI